MTDIQPPDLETRIAILQKKVRTDGIQVADPQLLTFIAGRVSTNIRELEALTRVVAFSSLTGRPMTVDPPRRSPRRVSAGRASAGLHRADSGRGLRALRALEGGADRRPALAEHRHPRQVAMYLSRELTDSSLPRIGRHFGGRDHTTVIHATSKIARLDPRGSALCTTWCAS